MPIVILYGVVSILLVIMQAASADRYTRTFIYLSAGFILLFYLMPLWIASNTGSLRLGTAYFQFSPAAIHRAGNGIVLFCGGYAFMGWLSWLVRRRSQLKSAVARNTISGPVEFAAMILLLGLAIYALYNGLYEETISIRRGEQQEVSYVFATFLISTYYIGCFYVLQALEEKKIWKAILWTAISVFLSINFVGRALLLLVLALPIIHYVRRAEIAFALIIICVAAFLPVIASGKQIIYVIMSHGDVYGAVADAYQSGISLFDIFGDISHLVVSYDYAPSLVHELGGYRFFWDIPQGFIFYLRLFGFDTAYSLTYYNTEAIYRIRESIVPPGFVAFGYIEASLPGVIIAGMMFRLIGDWVGRLRARLPRGSLATDFYFAFLAANSFYIGEPRALVLTLAFPCAIIFALTALTGKRSNKRTELRNLAA
jgi:hypothetical protein